MLLFVYVILQAYETQVGCNDPDDDINIAITESISHDVLNHSPFTVDDDSLSSACSSQSSNIFLSSDIISSADYDQGKENYCLPSAPSYSDITADV